MATEDLSRRTFDPRYNRRQVLGQVGRVLTDEDITAIGDVAADERRTDRLGIIGVHGTSNNGFRVSNVDLTDGVIDFTLEAGDYWIGGQRATLHENKTFRLQPDWLTREDIPEPTDAQHDLVVLEIFTQPVSAVEQEASFDPGLGGPDTVAHLRMMARVKIVSDLAEGACHDLWEETLGRWEVDGAGVLNPLDNELKGDGTLTVGFTDASGAMDLCSPDIDQGFLGAANRAIRVQMTSPTTFCWGFKNGGRLMRATVDAHGTGLTLLTEPKDEAHWPSVDQVIEVLPWGAVDFNGEKLAGEDDATHFTTVSVGYNPDLQTLTIADALPAGFNEAWLARTDSDDLQKTRFDLEDQAPFVFVRVWDRGEDRTSAPEMAIGADVVLGLTGLTVTHGGAMLRRGDAWVIAARPFAPDDIAPWELRIGTEPVERKRFVAALAHLDWDGAGGVEITDCRRRFRPLTRLNDCVTLRVGDGAASHGDYDKIQDAVNALPKEGGRILVLPGDYDEHVDISLRENIRIEGCGSRTRVVPATGDDAAPDDTPIFSIAGSTGITLQDMFIAAPTQLAVAVTTGFAPPPPGGEFGDTVEPADIMLKNLEIEHFQRGGIWMAAVTDAEVRDCLCRVTGLLDDAALAETIHRPSIHAQGLEIRIRDNTLTADDYDDKLAPALGGLTLGGGTEEARVTGNLIEGCYGNGITLGSIIYVEAKVLEDDTAISNAYTGAYGTVTQAYGFTISDDNCFGIDPIPPGTDDNGDGTIEVPIPDGPLYDIHIAENRIRTMGGNGIGVAQYFNLDADPFLITIEDMVILRNEITGVLSGENIGYPPEMQLVAAWAGIALADITRVEIRENTITGNSRKHDLPAVGIFALFAETVEIVENTIADTGRRIDEIDGEGAGPGGWRGGIAIAQVRPAPRDTDVVGDEDGPLRSDGSTALTVHGNSVRAPQGRALTAFGLGPMHVTDNRFVTQSGSATGFILALFNLRRFGQLSLAGLLLNAILLILLQRNRPNSTAAHLMLSIMGGDVVALGNLGVSQEFYLQGFGISDMLLGDSMELGFDSPGLLQVGGDIQLNDNQIRLDGLDGQASFMISAVALGSMDSVMAQSNQISLDLDPLIDMIGMNMLALGWTVHVADNRLKEPLLNCFCSALTLGLMNTTTDNQATHCLLPFAPWPNVTLNDRGNTELIELFSFFLPNVQEGNVELCELLRRQFKSNFKKDISAIGALFSKATASNDTNADGQNEDHGG